MLIFGAVGKMSIDQPFLFTSFMVLSFIMTCRYSNLLQVVDETDHERVLGAYPKILQWIENVKSATNPHFEEVHGILYKVKERLRRPRASAKNNIDGLGMNPNPKL